MCEGSTGCVIGCGINSAKGGGKSQDSNGAGGSSRQGTALRLIETMWLLKLGQLEAAEESD